MMEMTEVLPQTQRKPPWTRTLPPPICSLVRLYLGWRGVHPPESLSLICTTVQAEHSLVAPRRMAEQTTTITAEQPRPAGTLAHGPLAMRAIAIAAQATVVPMPKMIQPDSSGAYHVTVQAALLFPIHLS